MKKNRLRFSTDGKKEQNKWATNPSICLNQVPSQLLLKTIAFMKPHGLRKLLVHYSNVQEFEYIKNTYIRSCSLTVLTCRGIKHHY